MFRDEKKMKSIDYLKPQPYQKVLRVFNKRKNANDFSIITSYHSNGNLFQYLEVEKARAKGNYREWFPNGSQKIQKRWDIYFGMSFLLIVKPLPRHFV
jgi:antitoxin component YwqK of YwqJK toxin-antitoxin module